MIKHKSHRLWYNLFLNSLLYSALFLLGGLVLDLIYGHTIFQRFGAIIVGFAVLHVLKVSNLQGALNLLETAKNNDLMRFVDEIPNLNELENQVEDPKVMRAISELFKRINPPENLPKSEQQNFLFMTAFWLLKFREQKPETERRLKTIRRNEWVLAVVGTIIWAFGDWAVNFLYHCPGSFECKLILIE